MITHAPYIYVKACEREQYAWMHELERPVGKGVASRDPARALQKGRPAAWNKIIRTSRPPAENMAKRLRPSLSSTDATRQNPSSSCPLSSTIEEEKRDQSGLD